MIIIAISMEIYCEMIIFIFDTDVLTGRNKKLEEKNTAE
jgi:hypothetical protein